MKKCKNCQVNDARYICLGCSREFCTYCMKEDEFLCSQCRYNNKQQRQQEDEFKLKTNNHMINKIINIIIASSILFLGIILVLMSYPSIMNMISTNSSNDGIISEQKEDNNNNRNGYIYIFPLSFAIPIEFNMSFIIPLILTFIIIIPIIVFIIILKSIKIS